ncbi:hypothetical protein K450DRAFT_282086 [Umbelopsis ramanniana AG]|uniref:BHLH domain-containing protein n=1 Tax=Umbelopsis ramanniana AG TaxID=1314678 RepID=A0AAD5E5U9_UMBRA|nr:uncharacterized protein K450DRAFT_282086 [Umbelopsis ramanniana AG]KAI8577941.1 hypothetical protein K450DRAFT_282086 [Umbelopsis ramanniana AG]
MNYHSFDHDAMATSDMLKQQSYGHHSTYRNEPSEFDFFSLVENGVDSHHLSNDQLHQAIHANQKFMSNLPQLTPDTTEGNRTGSSVLTGHNPDYATMSPLNMATNPENAEEFHTPLQTSTRYTNHDEFHNIMDDENFFTPLVSPAITPVFNGGYSNTTMASMNHDVHFSPLSSPALHPHQSSPHFFGDMQSNGHQEDGQSAEAILQRKLALIEQQQQHLLALQQQQQQKMQQSASSPRLQSTSNNNKRGARSNSIKSPYQNGYNGNVKRQATLRQKIAMASPQLKSSMVSQTDGRSNGGYQTLGNMAHMSPLQQSASSPMLDSSMPPPLPQTSYSAASPHALRPAMSSAPSSPTSLAPATPASLMKLNGGRGSGSNSVSSSPSSNANAGDLGSVDHMPSLPDAILPMVLDAPPQYPLSSPSLKPTSNRRRSSTNRKNKKEPFASPAIAPNFGLSPRMSMSDPTIIMSPAALRPQVSQSPRALKPLISPSLKPNWPPTPNSGVVDQEAAAHILASKSNYQNLREGKIASLGMQFSPSIHSGIEIRRTAHKAAEQRRRDTLKKSFDCLRNEIVGSLVNETVQGAEDDDSTDTVVEDEVRKEKEKEVKQMSKVVLLQHSFEYIVRLKDDNRLKDSKLDRVTQKLRELRKQSGLPEVTEEEMEEEREEKAEARRRRIERTERLASSQREEEENNGDTSRRSSTRSNDVEESE